MATKYSQRFSEFAESHGYTLMSDYVNQRVKVELRCPDGHMYMVSPNKFRVGRRCPTCPTKKQIHAKNRFSELCDNRNWNILGEYQGAHTKVPVICDKGHKIDVTPNHIVKGYGCIKCACLCPEDAENRFIGRMTDDGYKLLSEYKTALKKVELECDEGHIYMVRPNDFNNGSRCPQCQGSTGQRILQEMLKEFDLGEVIYNDNKALRGFEIDIYYPELNIAIEYQGNYWHNLPDMKQRDKIKRSICKEKGIKLIEVWEDDFMSDQNRELSRIMEAI